MSLAERRAHLENALQTSLDTADHIMAALDQWDDEQEEGGRTELVAADPSFKAMAAHAGQTVTLHEPIILPVPTALAEPAELEITPEPQEADPAPPVAIPEPLGWYGAGNVVSFVGITLLSLVTRG
jgi:hypothetical protein